MLLVLASIVFIGSDSLAPRDHILLSQIRDFPFRRLLRLAGSRWRYSTPPPHGWVSQSESESHCDWRSVNLSVLVSSPVWGLWPDINYCLTVTVLSLGGRSLWREDGSVVCQSVSSIRSIVKVKVKVKVKVMLRPTVPLASLSWNKAPIWGLRPDLYYCWTVAGLLMWGALSDERTGLLFARLSQQY
jgi:hypothetical protein